MSNSPLNLALVISELDIGGAEKNFTNLAIELNERGHRLQVYSIDPPADRPQQLRFIQQLKHQNIPICFLTKSRPSSLRLAVNKLRKLLHQQKPDIVQAFLFRANLASFLATPRNAKLSLGIRQAENRFSVKTIEKLLIRRAAHTVFVSNQVAEHYPKSTRTRVIPNGQASVSSADIDVARRNRGQFWQDRLNLDIDDDNWVYLFAGRLTRQKNILQLLRTMDRALCQFPDDHFVILGSGDLEKEARQAARAASSSDRIHFAGWQPDPQIWIRHANLLVLMSLWEGLPNVLLESMAAAVPFVSYPTHGVRDLFFPHSTGLAPTSESDDTQRNTAYPWPVTPIATPQSLLQLLEQLRTAGNTTQGIAKWNHNWVQTHFSVAQMVDSYEHLFRQLAAK